VALGLPCPQAPEPDELELLLEDELEELELLEPVTLTEKFCVVWAPQLFVYMAVAVQEAAGVTVCSRELPEVPQPLQFQEPPEVGWGPNCTELPALMLMLDACCQFPLFTRR
jgi:hypothetical protein